MPKLKNKIQPKPKPDAVYFKSLTIRDIKCFRGEHTIDLSDGKGAYAQWTVILGNNNTGKTTILKCLAGLEAELSYSEYSPKGWTDAGKNAEVNSELLLKYRRQSINRLYSNFWGYQYKRMTIVLSRMGETKKQEIKNEEVKNLLIEPYGASRRMSAVSLSSEQAKERHANLFQNSDLPNVEEWYLQLTLAKMQGENDVRKKAKIISDKIDEILTSGLLPDVKSIKFNTEQQGQTFNNFIEFQTDFGWIRLRDLGYGYQTMLAWVLDLVRRMFERYPESPNPIREPAIVLVDEIDLHLHPEWQRKIIAHLTQYFPKTQFIVTAHSPLVVQSAEKINLVLLEKEGDHVNITQKKIQTYKGWTLEEILTELMGLDERIHSDVYLELIGKFDKALEDDNFEAAQAAYDELDKILHPQSNQRKLLRLQMSSLTPA